MLSDAKAKVLTVMHSLAPAVQTLTLRVVAWQMAS